MEVLDSTENKEKLWQTGDELYYPLGVTDPNYCVLKFSVKTGRLYNNLESKKF